MIGQDLLGKYVVVRTFSAGCFAGTLAERDGRECVLTDVRRLWKWAGAASLSELALRGPSRPNSCLFPAAIPTLLVTEVIEVIDATGGKTAIEAVPEWTAQ